jgi:hypothetical protein
MVVLASLIRVFARSLVLKLVSYATLAAGIGILALILGANALIQRQNRLEAEGVQRLAEAKVAERIDADIRLVSDRLRSHMGELEDSLTLIASLSTTYATIRTMPQKQIGEMLNQRLLRAGFTGGMVMDQSLAVLSHTQPNMEQGQGVPSLTSADLQATFAELIENNDMSSPATLRMLGPVEPELAKMLSLTPEQAYGYLIAVPIFDDVGDVEHLLVGYRALKRSEGILNAFSNATGAAIALMQANRPITIAGSREAGFSFPPANGTKPLLHMPEHGMVGRCIPSFVELSICVLRAEADISHFRDEIAAIGKQERGNTNSALLSIAALALISITSVISILALRLTRPLVDITGDVSRVSAGEWPVDVRHSARDDEIGRIARALVAMQTALIERDRMRQEMVRIEALNARRHVLEAALARFEHGMAGAMGNIARIMNTLGQTNAVLDRTAKETAQQVSSICDASQETSTRASAVAHAAIHLSNAMREIDLRARSTRDGVHESEGHAQLAENQLWEVTSSTRNAEEALSHIHQLVADLARRSLGISLKSGENVHSLAEIAQFNALAAKAAEAAAITEAELARLGTVAEGATLSISDMKGGLGHALENMAEITVMVAEQSATAREMTESLCAASHALSGLTEAVERIRTSMGEAQDASDDFVTLARMIAQDARMVDESVRIFVRDAAA